MDSDELKARLRKLRLLKIVFQQEETSQTECLDENLVSEGNWIRLSQPNNWRTQKIILSKIIIQLKFKASGF